MAKHRTENGCVQHRGCSEVCRWPPRALTGPDAPQNTSTPSAQPPLTHPHFRMHKLVVLGRVGCHNDRRGRPGLYRLPDGTLWQMVRNTCAGLALPCSGQPSPLTGRAQLWPGLKGTRLWDPSGHPCAPPAACRTPPACRCPTIRMALLTAQRGRRACRATMPGAITSRCVPLACQGARSRPQAHREGVAAAARTTQQHAPSPWYLHRRRPTLPLLPSGVVQGAAHHGAVQLPQPLASQPAAAAASDRAGLHRLCCRLPDWRVSRLCRWPGPRSSVPVAASLPFQHPAASQDNQLRACPPAVSTPADTARVLTPACLARI